MTKREYERLKKRLEDDYYRQLEALERIYELTQPKAKRPKPQTQGTPDEAPPDAGRD